jgi:hypothetical protein
MSQADARSSQGDEERRRAENELSQRLRDRGVRLSGRETSDELVNILEAVERFESAVEHAGGDLMMDEPVREGSPIQPDNAAFVLPRRHDGESVDAFLGRIAFAATRIRAKRAD